MKNSVNKIRMIHNVDQKTIDQMFDIYSPIVLLTTGRSGSKFIVTLFDSIDGVSAYHEPEPNLMYFSDFVFHNQGETEILEKMFLSSRMELILKHYIEKKTYFESNQCLAFFAPSILKVFKNTRFIHLIRHPGDFVASAVRKGWHKNDSIWESGRVKMSNQKKWNNLTHIEKLAWVWTETNNYIERFKENLDKEQIITVKFEEIISKIDVVKIFFKFFGISDISDTKIQEIQKIKINTFRTQPIEPINMKKNRDFPKYNEWDLDLKQKAYNYLEKYSKVHDYKL